MIPEAFAIKRPPTGGSRGGGGPSCVGTAPPVSTLKARCGCIGHCNGSVAARLATPALTAAAAVIAAAAVLLLALVMLMPNPCGVPFTCCC